MGKQARLRKARRDGTAPKVERWVPKPPYVPPPSTPESRAKGRAASTAFAAIAMMLGR